MNLFPLLERLKQSDVDGYLSSFKPLERNTAETKLKNERFIVKEKKFVNQYASLYFNRLMMMKLQVKSRAAKRWPNTKIVDKMISIPEGESVLIGTLFKEIKLRPNVIEEYTRSRNDKKPVERSHFVSDQDALVLEDNHARISLDFSAEGLPEVKSLVSGIVLAVRGKNDKTLGTFKVTGVQFADLPKQQKLVSPEKDQYVALVSGLRLGNAASQQSVQILTDFIIGMVGGSGDAKLASNIVQVVIAGNSVEIMEEEEPNYAHFSKGNKSENDRRMNNDIQVALQDLDIHLTSLASAVDVLIMPGADDPANFTLPQQPFPRFLLQSASSYSTFHSCTNPCDASVQGVQILGTSGQNVHDLAKYSVVKSPIDHLENTLRWRHIAPTAPDTLGCHAFTDTDPLVIRSCPHIYFAGNQASFASKLVEGSEGQQVRVVMVPDFSKTRSIALVNLRNLECIEVKVPTLGIESITY